MLGVPGKLETQRALEVLEGLGALRLPGALGALALLELEGAQCQH